MQLTVFGKYGPYPKAGGRTSGYMLSSGEAFAFEMGAGVFSALSEKVPPETLSAVIISHLHYDHISDLGVFNYYLESLARSGKLKSNMRLIIPKDSGHSDYIAGMKYFDIDAVADGERRKVGDMTVRFFSVKHSVPCLGFTAECEGKKFLYSGDTALCINLLVDIEGADLVLADGAFLPEQFVSGSPHASVKQLAELSNSFGVRMLISHLLPQNSEEKIREAIAGADLCEVAEEGKTYSF